jgi:hypothetical protein
MAVMSFAHLKKGTAQQPVIIPPPTPDSRVIVSTQTSGKVMSFAHLKTKVKTSPKNAPEKNIPIRLQRPRGIVAMKTALLVSVNYCEECPRFWPADENDKKWGTLYGRCRRNDVDGMEVWKSIPSTAMVLQCWYHLYGKAIVSPVDQWAVELKSETEWKINFGKM